MTAPRPLCKHPGNTSCVHPNGTAGFTFAELLLASALGAMLLSALAASTVVFTENLRHLEVKAGIAEDVDSVLGAMTRDVREAWLAEVLAAGGAGSGIQGGAGSGNSERLVLTQPGGGQIVYWRENDDVHVMRPDGNEDVLLEDIESLVLSQTMADRLREGAGTSADAVWFAKGDLATPAQALEVPVGGLLSLAVVPPLNASAIGGSADDQLNAAAPGLLSVPVSWIPGSGGQLLQVSLFESRGPGSAIPDGNSLGSLSLDGDAVVPPAVGDGFGGWLPPTANINVGLDTFGASLSPGVGYCLVLEAGGDAQVLAEAYTFFGDPDDEDVAVQDTDGIWDVKAMRVPLALSGVCSTTSTLAQQVVSRVSITIVPNGRPLQTRSVSVLSQVLSDDPWLGVVAGDSSP